VAPVPERIDAVDSPNETFAMGGSRTLHACGSRHRQGCRATDLVACTF
jgi:hypothetical protein